MLSASLARLYTLGQELQNLLFPPQCAGCKAVGYEICPECAQAVVPIEQPICLRCGRLLSQAAASQALAGEQISGNLCERCAKDASPSLRLVRSAALHLPPLDHFIHEFKYNNRPELAAPLASYLYATFLKPLWREIAPTIDLVAPVPMDANRKKERGYNQAELLAAQFCRFTGLTLRTNLLKRVWFERAQVGLNFHERQANVEGAFIAHPTIRGATVLLIDDVSTTGATLRACAQAAREAGAVTVYGLALATPALKTNQ